MGWVKIAENEPLSYTKYDVTSGVQRIVDAIVLRAGIGLVKSRLTTHTSNGQSGSTDTKTFSTNTTVKYKIVVKSITPASYSQYMNYKEGYEQEVTSSFVQSTNYGIYSTEVVTAVDIYQWVNTPPTFTQIPTQATKKDAVITINLANYFSDADGNALTFAVSSSNPNIATATVSGSTLTLTGKEIGSTRITVDANDGQYTTTQSFTLNITNTAPTVSVSSPAANITLYENDVLTVTGAASDTNSNQSVTVYAQINNEQRIVLAVGLSNAQIPFNKQLKFKGGQLYDGDTPITGNLADGVPHTLKIWAQDGDGGQSTIAERTFYVVPNRVPLLTVNQPVISGNIDSDKIQFNGEYSDPDGNACTVSYKINGGNSVQVASGVSGNWSFEITFGQLKEGTNTIVIENIDSYGAKTSKTVKLNKAAIETPLLKSVARYKLTPPLNEATGVLLYVQRSADLVTDVKISMTLAGEPENFVPMSLENTAPVPNEVGIVEDELYYIASESKQNIIVQIEMERSSVNVNDKIIVIEGAFY